ncbi:MAG: nucleoside kinase [Treponema sp.]|nr:nucleoside kinase [Spirochaetia bacterium]MDD7767550.1 nucleoside kinase [Treponema sp.]MDY3130676.1 nucleoside kinase [Treponema sp.]
MAKPIKITYNRNQKIETTEAEIGTQVFNFMPEFSINGNQLVAAKVNNELTSLDAKLEFDCKVEPVYNNTKEGMSVYRRSLCLLLATAAHRINPKTRLIVGNSICYGYYYTFDGEKIPAKSLKQEMEKLISRDLRIKTEYVSWEQAAALFEKLNLKETRKQLNHTCKSKILINTIEDFSDMYFGPLVLSTGALQVFDLIEYQDGLLLRFPKTKCPSQLPAFKDEPKLFSLFKQYKEWGKRVNVLSAASLNDMVANGKINDFIDIAETHQEKCISDIASQIVKSKKVRVVLIAGPSSSGKTTSAKKLGLELQAMGYTPKLISLDCYYAGRDKAPLDENGKPDYECLEALNVELLNQNLVDLFAGKEVNIPSYDFHTGTSYFEDKNKMTLADNEILIMEGIHGLNPKLTAKVPEECKFKIYLSALTQLNLDDHNRISTSDNRLIRRIVRDNNFRGKPAEGTIAMWPSVQKGEELHIFPFHNNADAILNTALDYELSILRVYAAPLLRRVPPTMAEYSEAQRLLNFLENFATIAPTEVPPRSIIREFIGGSAFKY